jgi:hypothetical protein
LEINLKIEPLTPTDNKVQSWQIIFTEKANMPILLSDFMQQHQPGASIAPMLEKMYRHPPTFKKTQKSPHFSPRYQAIFNESDALTQVMTILCEKEMLPLLSSSALIVPSLHQKHVTFWKSLAADKTEATKRYIFGIGSNFNLLGLGNCAPRATYAAMQLHPLLKDTGIQIKLVSLTSVDQFIVYLKTPDKLWYVYDPLTNPELLFTPDEYKSAIMPLFTKVPSPAAQVDLTITPALCEHFRIHCDKIEPFLTKAFQKPWQDTLQDGWYRMSLSRAKLPLDQQEQITKEAHQAIHRKLAAITEARIEKNPGPLVQKA